MIRWLTDEDFNGRIIRGLRLQQPGIDLVRIQDVGLMQADDATVLEWAESANHVLLTHDGRTMPRHFRTRLDHNAHVPGVFIVDDNAAIGHCIYDVLLIEQCSSQEEWRDQLYYLPFR